jgi:hypothetical protein
MKVSMYVRIVIAECVALRWNRVPAKCTYKLNVKEIGLDFAIRKRRIVWRCIKRYKLLPSWMYKCKIRL